ncbi:MAG: TetR/AcrR family transcriptional regulator [Solobacterium sp.]|nr:TetR/AcrR family transcriptional regulator [Solobacterium sp.]
MAPKVKFQKNEIIEAAYNIARLRGIDTVTAREVAAFLKISPRPIFTYYDTMEELRHDVFEMAKEHYKDYLVRGLQAPVPFLGVGRQYIRFAREEPYLYKLLFLTRPDGTVGGVISAMAMSQDLVRDSIMKIYAMDAFTADCYFRDLWLVAFSFATLIVTDECPYTDEQISAVLSEVSLAVCKAYKEIPGLAEGKADKDAVFKALVNKQKE